MNVDEEEASDGPGTASPQCLFNEVCSFCLLSCHPLNTHWNRMCEWKTHAKKVSKTKTATETLA